MFDGNYVIFIPHHLPPANVQTPWVTGDEDDDVIKKAYRHVFQVTVAEMAGEEVTQFRKEVPVKMAQPPWNYNATLLSGRQGSEYSPFLHDVVYLYLLVLNETVGEGEDHTDGQLLFNKATSRTFRGVTGNVKLDGNGDRLPDYWLWRMSRDDDVFSVAMEARMTSEAPQKVFVLRPVTWLTQDGSVPPDTPVCGFFGDLCPPDSAERNIIASVSTVAVLIVVVIIVAGIVYRRHVMLERELEQMLWKVEYGDIHFTKTNCVGSISQMSLLSAASAPPTVPSSRRSSLRVGEGQMFSAVGLYRGGVVAIKKVPPTKADIGRAEQLHLKAMKELNHENLLSFIGLCVDERFPCILTAYCAKGSLQDLIENDDINLDWTFKISLVNDLVNGMNYLHSSPIRFHGRLKSSNCLVDNRWILKVADFGLEALWHREVHPAATDRDAQWSQGMLWTAPEVLRQREGAGAMATVDRQRADVYSFAIVLYEVVCRCYPFDTDHATPAVIIGRIQRVEDPPFRPSLPAEGGPGGQEGGKGEGGPVPGAVYRLMRTCWAETPADRPLFPALRASLAALTKGRKCGIVDNMLLMLEKYANNLEDIVQQRTGQLIEERKKSDMLLYRMLPQVVAEKLKGGQQVTPELYEAVTIYFSDIVGFTALASASSPMQVVDLLNDLYTSFDSVIARHHVYKVETIGDAYMVVSGAPERNENRHVTEIANMALDLLASIHSFQVRHRPGLKLCLRVGLHTGPCATGVVGLTMPRYCLFGDTVNTASRMESTGLPLKIQVSQQTKDMLDDFGGYCLTYRGTIEVKGKGQQSTYWLEGKEHCDMLQLPHPPSLDC
ncbi:atrial natriuretic peptide receptor 1-like [Babylonia areolata]|uniref:atrial natriuretic peptide receptor 1-like n=1 Tax=Babylonia areolata TaxID=304850 RepID=UPI003FD32C1D